MIALAALLFSAPLLVIAGMTLEWRTGRLNHWIHKVSPPVHFPTPQPIRAHDEFLDDCDRFNRAMIKTPVDQRVFEPSETLQ